MLSFHLDANQLGLGWRATPAGFECGISRVHPLRHDALEEVVVTCGSRLLVCVRERCAGRSGPPGRPGAPPADVDGERFDRLAEELRAWPLQWHLLVVGGGERLATVDAGLWGTAPVFLVADRDELRGDWDASRLLPHLRRTDLDPARAARFLAEFATPYERNTLFRGLRLVTERARADWVRRPGGGTELCVTYPPAWRRPIAGTLLPGADPVGTFAEITAASLARWADVAGDTLGSELSGGLDSGIVTATAAARAGSSLRSYGIELLGPCADDQAARRAELVELFKLHDTRVPIRAHLPLAPGSPRVSGQRPALPWEDAYSDVEDVLMARAHAAGIRVMATGFGGDELCGLRPSERRNPRPEDLAPEPVTGPAYLTADAQATLDDPLDPPPMASSCSSSVECAAFSAARYLRQGIWPIHPLCTPELVHFCARLPAPWRARRTVERELLARLGCTARVTHPRDLDDFSPALASSMSDTARPLLRELFAAPVLAELGIVNGERLRREYADWCEYGGIDDAVRYYAVAVTELCLSGMR